MRKWKLIRCLDSIDDLLAKTEKSCNAYDRDLTDHLKKGLFKFDRHFKDIFRLIEMQV